MGVTVTVGDNSIVGVKVIVGSEVAVRVGGIVAFGVSVNSFVAVLAGVVGVAGRSVEGAQAETNRKIKKMTLEAFMLILLTLRKGG